MSVTIKRILEISNKSYLRVEHQQLKVEQNGEVVSTVPLEDVGTILLNHPAIVLSMRVLQLCAEKNVVVITCDPQHSPSALNLPLWDAHSLHSKVLSDQIRLNSKRAGQLWKLIVREKLLQQSLTLERFKLKSLGVRRYRERVTIGDKANIEAHAARLYWRTLFGPDFRRDRTVEGVNTLLNYGYGVFRAALARAVVGTGLHPSLGLHHTNQYNSFNLVDDLIEPFRPWVDEIVMIMQSTGQSNLDSQDTKRQLLGLVSGDCFWKNEKLPIEVALQRYLSHFKKLLTSDERVFMFPQRYES